MFNFFSEIKNELKMPFLDAGYNLVDVNGKAVYVEGHKGLVSLSNEMVRLKVKDKIITINGKDLKLKIMSSSTISVTGEIKSIVVD
ncbi:MAG: YabP/YqfC family sporulation protein [Clostridia bacterium]|nr:YabP/YqfC family sporulation protein [Clostridia bacterium]